MSETEKSVLNPDMAAAHAVIEKIALCAENIAFSAGVGSLETAGQIVSFLVGRPSLMQSFMDGSLSPVDTGLLDPHNGVLSYYGMDGSVHRPEPSRARFPAPPIEKLDRAASPNLPSASQEGGE